MFKGLASLFRRRPFVDRGVSIICVYNNSEKLEKYLMPSLKKQTVLYELFTIDNTKDTYKSASAILNETVKRAKYEYLMFVHQDVRLESGNWLKDVQRDISSLPGLGAAGVAGKNVLALFASVRHGIPPQKVNRKRFFWPLSVQTLDGCLMIVPKKVFEQVLFDEKTIEGWYMYTDDFCLDLKRLGYNCYVLPRWIYHESRGPKNRSSYLPTLQKIIEKHRDHTKVIYTTYGNWKTDKDVWTGKPV